MPTLDFELEYTYPDDQRGISLQVELEAGPNRARLLAFLDTGAKHCLFQSDYADLLGLDLRRGMPLTFSAAGGGSIDAFGHFVSIEVLGQRRDSMVFFTDHPGFRRNVLGRQGWLHHFRLGLVHYESKLYLGSMG